MVSWQVGRLAGWLAGLAWLAGWLDGFPLQLMKGDSWQGLEVARLPKI